MKKIEWLPAKNIRDKCPYEREFEYNSNFVGLAVGTEHPEYWRIDMKNPNFDPAKPIFWGASFSLDWPEILSKGGYTATFEEAKEKAESAYFQILQEYFEWLSSERKKVLEEIG
jgi:hypothetical protein